MIDPDDVAERAAAVRAELGHRSDEITIMAVTKAFGFDAVEAAAAAGFTAIGESYAQECVAKLDGRAVGPDVHFVGRLQRNKVRRLADVVDVFQSVDRPELITEIAKRAPGARILLQVDISGEPQKGGCAPGEVADLLDAAANAGLSTLGLMGIGPIGEPEAARPGFALLRSLVDRHGLRVCSMGMSADLAVAAAEGSTMVRVGTGLFGPRPAR
ncbi:MAG: YggS family pyridoxal phosphate enzyme [Actinomycetota bacterium]